MKNAGNNRSNIKIKDDGETIEQEVCGRQNILLYCNALTLLLA